MSKVFISPEPHLFDKNFKGRINYPEEVYRYLETLYDVVSGYRNAGETCYVIFPGDVCHQGFTDVVGVITYIEWCKNLNRLVDGNLYSAVGNHELTYHNNNPFWMACDLQSEYFAPIKYIPGYGTVSEGFKVVDEVTVDNTLFVLGHYGRTKFEYDFEPYDDVQFISHNAVMDKEVQATLEKVEGRDTVAEFSNYTSIRGQGILPLTSKLSNVYFGHMHMAYSTFNVAERIQDVEMKFSLKYLGSLGRTNHTEVNNSDLVRSIYIVDTITHEVTDYKVTLQTREECIREEVVAAAHDKYEKTKAIQQLRRSNQAIASPLQGIRDWLAPLPFESGMFNSIYETGSYDDMDALILIAKGELNNATY